MYISSVILDIFHSQTDPTALCLAIKNMPVSMVTAGLHDYLKTWLPPYKVQFSAVLLIYNDKRTVKMCIC